MEAGFDDRVEVGDPPHLAFGGVVRTPAGDQYENLAQAKYKGKKAKIFFGRGAPCQGGGGGPPSQSSKPGWEYKKQKK